MFSHEEIQSFNDLELSVYQYIIKNKEKISYMKIRELAQEAHVSTTTVLRFCKKLGCEGYSEFKIRFKMHLTREEEQQSGPGREVLVDCISRMESEEFNSVLKQAVELLKQFNYIIFIGVGNSGILGKYGARYFSNVGRFALCIDDPFTPVYIGNSSETAVIALSVSGETSEILNLANQFKSRGCALISITSSSNCTLAKISDCNLSYHLQPQKLAKYYDITSQVPVIYALELLGQQLYDPSAVVLR